MDELVENFIVTKALQAFAHYGTIPSVTYVEDQVKQTFQTFASHRNLVLHYFYGIALLLQFSLSQTINLSLGFIFSFLCG